VEKYPDLVKEVQHKFIDYIKLLQEPRTVVPATTTRTRTVMVEMANGFPKVPEIRAKDKVTKDEAEGLLRPYLTAVYSGYG
jgi:hypothetical protein